jgi:small subunit ribosomal protein S12
MTTLRNIAIKRKRKGKKKLNRTPALFGNPQRRGVCYKVVIRSPKKPCSGQRKVCKLRMCVIRNKKHIRRKRIGIECSIPGIGHTLQEYSIVLMRGGRVRDVPGLKYRGIRGKLDFKGVKDRKLARSKYGTKNLELGLGFGKGRRRKK